MPTAAAPERPLADAPVGRVDDDVSRMVEAWRTLPLDVQLAELAEARGEEMRLGRGEDR